MRLLYSYLALTLSLLRGITPCYAIDTADEKIKIGVSVPLTGDAATYGLDIQEFLRFADRTLGNDRYQLLFEDDKCNGKEAVAVANKLLNADKVKYVIGLACSGATLAAAPLYEKAHTPTIVVFASSPRIRDAGDFIFRTYPSDSEAGKLLYEHVKRHHRSIALLSEQTDYAQDLKNVFVNQDTTSQLTIISEDYLPDTVDFRTMLLRLRARNPEALFINTQAERTFAVILEQLGQVHWSPALFGAYWPGSPALLRTAKNNLNGTVFVDTPSLDSILTAEGHRILKQYKQNGGKIRSTEAVFATSYEAYRALVTAISSGSDVKEFLYKTEFAGLFGPYRFDRDGEIQGISLVLKQIEHGQPTSLQE